MLDNEIDILFHFQSAPLVFLFFPADRTASTSFFVFFLGISQLITSNSETALM